MLHHTGREILALLSSKIIPKIIPKIINKVMVKGRWEGSKARTKRESRMRLPPSQRKLTASLSWLLLSRKESSEPGPAGFFQRGSDSYSCKKEKI